MRATALAFVIEHWQFFLSAFVVGLAIWGVYRVFKGMADKARAKRDAELDRQMEAEMQRVRDELRSKS